MPIFSNKFVAKKSQPRKFCTIPRKGYSTQAQLELGLEYDLVKLELNNNILEFNQTNGMWKAINYENDYKKDLKKSNKQLIEENRMLKLKIDILIDMVK